MTHAPEEQPPVRSFESLEQQFGAHYRWLAIAAVGMGTFAALMMTTSVNVAIPSIMGAFGVNQDTAQWLSTGYLAGTTVSMLTLSWCVTHLGIWLAYLIPTLVFAFASVLAGLSTNIETMIFARVLQGAAGGLYMPLSGYLLTKIFPLEQRGFAMGIFGILTVTGPAIGPYIGGLVIDSFNWRAVFYLSLPLTLISIPMAHQLLPDRDPEEAKSSLDWYSIGLLSLALISILNGLTKGQDHGWSSNYTLFNLTLGVVCIAGFVVRQTRLSNPLMDLRLFQYPTFRQAMLISLIFGLALYGGMYLIPLFLQSVQHQSATAAGFALLPGGLCMAFAMLVGGYLSDRVPAHILMISGMLLLAYSFAVMYDADQMTSLTDIIWWIIIGRVGIAIVHPALNLSSFASLPDHLLSQASGTANFLRQLGGALGVNLISIFLARQTSLHVDQIMTTQQADNPQIRQTFESLMPVLTQNSSDPMLSMPMVYAYLSGEMYRQATIMAYQDAFAFCAILATITLLPVWLIKRASQRNKTS